MGKLEESALLKNVRVVHAKLETMDEEANLRPDMIEHLENDSTIMTWLDHHLKEEKFFPQETFDVGILNNDVVGYLHEYYNEYSDAADSLRKVHKVLKKGALLVVTNPCSLYVVDNVQILESLGFDFLEGLDIDLLDESFLQLDRSTEPQTMSRLGHYTFLIFVRK
jgi:SAM-dependent methyltransferase